MRLRRVIPLIGAMLASSSVAFSATPADAAAAQSLFERGRQAAQQGDLALACASFAESQRLEPGAGTLMNWATCEARQGKVASAWQHFNEAASLLRPGDDRAGFVRRQIRGLAARLPRLTLRVAAIAPSESRVLRGGSELGRASIGTPLPVDPGRVELVLLCAGHRPRRQFVSIGEGEQLEITLEPGDAILEARRPVMPPSPARTSTEPRSLQRDLGMSLVALGSLGVGLGVASGVVVAARRGTAEEHCPEQRCDGVGLAAATSGSHWLTVNTLAWSVGAVALVTGGALWLTTPNQQHQAAVLAVPGGAALSLTERF
jgi:hypothetical protein